MPFRRHFQFNEKNHWRLIPTGRDLVRRDELVKYGFKSQDSHPFILSLHCYLHHNVVYSGIDGVCKALYEQIFTACRNQTAHIPGPEEDAHEYHTIKVGFNIATTTIGPSFQTTDVQAILTAIMWHLGSSKKFMKVGNNYELHGRCRGMYIVVLQLRDVSNGFDTDEPDQRRAYFPRRPSYRVVNLETLGMFEKKDDYDSSDENEYDPDGWALVRRRQETL